MKLNTSLVYVQLGLHFGEMANSPAHPLTWTPPSGLRHYTYACHIQIFCVSTTHQGLQGEDDRGCRYSYDRCELVLMGFEPVDSISIVKRFVQVVLYCYNLSRNDVSVSAVSIFI